MTEEFAIKLEKLYQQIEDESYEIAKVFTGSSDAPGKPIINSTRKEFYKKGATPYGEKWQEAEHLIEKMAKALEKVKTHTIDKETYHTYEIFFKEDLENALSDYSAYKQKEALTLKPTTDDTANG